MGSIIVTDDAKKPLGIFTERDYLLKMAGEETKFLDSPIEEYMTKEPKTVNGKDSIYNVMELMYKGRFRHIVIVNDKEQVAGVLSIKDILEFLMNSHFIA